MEREWSGNARRLSHADRATIESLIFGGATFEAAATAVGCSTKSIERFLATTGGIKRRLKPRSPLRLSLGEREELSRGLVGGDSLGAIARRLRRAPSTISREVAWSGSRDRYRAWRADRGAAERSRDRSRPSWPSAHACVARWSAASGRTGLHSRSRPGSSMTILAIWTCAYRTRRSTSRSSSRPAVRCGRSSRPVSGPVERSAVPTCGPSDPARGGYRT